MLLAAQFIAWNASNILMMLGGLCLFIVCIAGAIGIVSQESDGVHAVIAVGFALFFIIGMGVVLPHMRTVEAQHTKMAFAQLPREYPALKVVKTSVNDHWVEFRLPACGSDVYRYDNMRLINGRYVFATTVVKGSDSQTYNVYRPIGPSAVSSVCATSSRVTS